MSLFDRFRRGQLKLNRIEALSDGVFAIVLTLLVLDLKVPAITHGRDPVELVTALAGMLPNLVSWLISFIIVAKFWLNHHHVMGLALYSDYALAWLNALFLMFQTFVPLPTALMGAYPDNPAALSVFGLVMALNTLLFMILHRYILRHLLRPELRDEQDPLVIRKSFIGVASYLVGAALGWVHPVLAFAAYFITPWFFIVPAAPGPAASPHPDSRPAG